MLRSVSVVIPVRNSESELSSCLEGLSYQTIKPNIIVADGGSKDGSLALAQKYGCDVFTLAISPSLRRNEAVNRTQDDIIGFLDSDAIPESRWLENALKRFDSDSSIGVVCGPNLTPPNTPLRAKVTGDVLSTFLGAGISRERWTKNGVHRTDERSSMLCNMFVKRSVFQSVNGFHKWFGGEENDLVQKIEDAGHKVVYDENVVAYHQRVPVGKKFWKQTFVYSRGRGSMLRRHSVNPFYFLPTVLVITDAVLLVFIPVAGLALLGTYFAAVGLTSLKLYHDNKYHSLKTFGHLLVSFFTIHVSYALGFPYGFISPNNGKERGR